MKKLYSVDRFEGEMVILVSDKEVIEVEKSKCPLNVKEGSVLAFDGENYFFDTDAQRKIKSRIIEKQKNLFKQKSRG